MALDDRRIHAVSADGRWELVRYERAGKWFYESPQTRRQVTISEAVNLASVDGMQVRLRVPGGSTFDARYRRRNA